MFSDEFPQGILMFPRKWENIATFTLTHIYKLIKNTKNTILVWRDVVTWCSSLACTLWCENMGSIFRPRAFNFHTSLKGVCHEIFDFQFFSWSGSLINRLKHFRIRIRFRRDIRSQSCLRDSWKSRDTLPLRTGSIQFLKTNLRNLLLNFDRFSLIWAVSSTNVQYQ